MKESTKGWIFLGVVLLIGVLVGMALRGCAG